MAYTKVPLPCADYAFGYRRFNELATNCDAIAATITPGHGVGSAGYAHTGRQGRHTDPLGARYVGRWSSVIVLGATLFSDPVGRNLVSGVTRNDTGDYSLTVTGLLTYRLAFQPEWDSISTTRWISSEFVGQSPNNTAAFRVYLWQQSGTPFVAADYAFTLSVWGTTG